MLVLFLQAAAILILTPAYLASAFTEEKERKTLHFLYVTSLRDHELVLGKLLGRLALLGTILIVGLPVLSACLAYGPVELSLIATGMAASVLALLSTGSISILCSVWLRTTQEAILSSYGILFIMGIICIGLPPVSPILFAAHCEEQIETEWKSWEEELANRLSTNHPDPRMFPQTRNSARGTGGLPLLAKPKSVDIRLNALVPYSVVHGLAFFFCTGLSIWIVRVSRKSSAEMGPLPVRPAELMHLTTPLPVRLAQEERTWQHDSVRIGWPIKEPALLWKEMELGQMRLPASVPNTLAALFSWKKRDALGVAACIALLYYFRWSLPKDQIADLESGVALLIGYSSIVAICIWCLFLSFRVAGSITREREQDTLHALLMLPVERHEILRAKWLGSILRFGQIGYALAIIWLLGLVIGALHPLAFVLLVTACATYLSFFSAIGLWISLVSRSTLWANLSMALVLMLCFTIAMANPLASALEIDRQHNSRSGQAFELLANPSYVILLSAFSWHALDDPLAKTDDASDFIYLRHGAEPDRKRLRRNLVMIPVNVALFGSAAWVFWLLSRRKFRSVIC